MTVSFRIILALLLSVSALSACSSRSVPQPAAYASLQEVMDGIVDPAADDLWGAVETTLTRDGVEEKQPRTPEEWAEVRRKAVTLIEASTLLAIDGRRVAVKPFPAEAAGALDSQHIQQRIRANHPAFIGFAGALRSAAQQALAAIDARDPVALVQAGGALDGVCEGCHTAFWYPDQVIPPLP